MKTKLVPVFLIFALTFFAAGAASAANAEFVVEAVTVLEENYVDPLDRCELFNAAIDGLAKILEEAKLPVVLESISENDCPQAQEHFKVEFSRAVKISHGKLDETELAFGTTRHMAESLNDSHVYFLTPERHLERKEILTGKIHYAGIGASLHKEEGVIYIVEVFDEAPANGLLLPFDRIVTINNKEIDAEMTVADVIGLIRGEEGSGLTITIMRRGIPEPLGFTLIRALVKPPVVSDRMLTDNVGYIKVRSFLRLAVSDEVNSKVKKLSDDGMKAIILDLRGNNGGLLQEVIAIAGTFFPKKTILCKERDNKIEKDVLVERSFFQPYLSGEETPVVALIDSGSASGSEILAAAMQEHGRAILVGEKTAVAVDKAVFFRLPEDAGMVITVKRIITPKGVALGKVGVTPDVVVPFESKDYALGRDPQLLRALDIIKSKLK